MVGEEKALRAERSFIEYVDSLSLALSGGRSSLFCRSPRGGLPISIVSCKV